MNQKSWSESKLAPWNWFKDEGEQQVNHQVSESHPIARFHRDIDRLFEDTFRALNVPNLFDAGASPMWQAGQLLRPNLDIEEHADHYSLSVELPGVGKDDLLLNLEGQVLTIRGEKKHESKSSEEGQFHRVERSYGSFSRSLTLPDDIDAKSIEASFKDGVLHISIKRSKKHEVKGTIIPIKSS